MSVDNRFLGRIGDALSPRLLDVGLKTLLKLLMILLLIEVL